MGTYIALLFLTKVNQRTAVKKVAKLEIGEVVISQKCPIAYCKHSVKKEIVELNVDAPNQYRDWGRTLESEISM